MKLEYKTLTHILHVFLLFPNEELRSKIFQKVRVIIQKTFLTDQIIIQIIFFACVKIWAIRRKVIQIFIFEVNIRNSNYIIEYTA